MDYIYIVDSMELEVVVMAKNKETGIIQQNRVKAAKKLGGTSAERFKRYLKQVNANLNDVAKYDGYSDKHKISNDRSDDD